MPFLAWLAFLSKSSNDSTVNTFFGPEAICLSSEGSTSFPIPRTKTAAPFFWRRLDAISRGVYTPWSAVCFPVVITKTGEKETKQCYVFFINSTHTGTVFFRVHQLVVSFRWLLVSRYGPIVITKLRANNSLQIKTLFPTVPLVLRLSIVSFYNLVKMYKPST